MFPRVLQSDMTIYNYCEDEKGQYYEPTVLNSVFWQNNYGAKLTEKGIATTDKIAVLILFSNLPVGKAYISPFEFSKLPAGQKKLHWTIAKGDKIINLAATETVNKASELEKMFGYDNVNTVTGIVINNFGSQDMRHFKVIGK